MSDETKTDILTLLKRLVPGTIDIRPCKNIESCMIKKTRCCLEIKTLCVSSINNTGNVIGGISFLFEMVVNGKKHGIILQRYGMADNYVTMVEGNGINDIMNRLDKDKVMQEISEKTEFLKKEEEDAKNLEMIEAFKRRIDNNPLNVSIILVTKKNNDGTYGDLDKELIKIANENIEKGENIKIIDNSEIVSRVYMFGIKSKKVVKKIELESKKINDADDRIRIWIIPTRPTNNAVKVYNGILAINSIEDDIVETNDIKDRWKQYFTEKYTGVEFIEYYENKANILKESEN